MGVRLLRAPTSTVSFQIISKRCCVAPTFLTHLYMHPFRICWPNYRPSSFEVKSPGHVKWPHLIKSLNARHSYTGSTISWNFQQLIRVPLSIECSSYKLYIGNLRPGQFCDLTIRYKSMRENWKALLLDKGNSIHLQTSVYRWAWHSESENWGQWPLVMSQR